MPNRNSTACTCYAAGGMSLAFTQDFLVFNKFFNYFDIFTIRVCGQVMISVKSLCLSIQSIAFELLQLET